MTITASCHDCSLPCQLLLLIMIAPIMTITYHDCSPPWQLLFPMMTAPHHDNYCFLSWLLPTKTITASYHNCSHPSLTSQGLIIQLSLTFIFHEDNINLLSHIKLLWQNIVNVSWLAHDWCLWKLCCTSREDTYYISIVTWVYPKNWPNIHQITTLFTYNFPKTDFDRYLFSWKCTQDLMLWTSDMIYF